MSNIIETMKSQFSNTMISQVSAAIGESEIVTTKAVTAGVPALLTTIMQLASNTQDASVFIQQLSSKLPGLQKLSSMLSSSSDISNVGQESFAITKELLGSKAELLVSALASYSGAEASKIQKIIGIISAAVLSNVGTQLQTTGMNASSFMSLFASQRESILKALPAGLGSLLGGAGMASALSKSSNADISSKVSHSAMAKSSGEGLGFMAPLALLAIIIGGAWYLYSSQESNDLMASSATSMQVAAQSAKNAVNEGLAEASKELSATKESVSRAVEEGAKQTQESLQAAVKTADKALEVAKAATTEAVESVEQAAIDTKEAMTNARARMADSAIETKVKSAKPASMQMQKTASLDELTAATVSDITSRLTTTSLTESSKPVVLRGLTFAFNKAELTKESIDELKLTAEALKKFPNSKLLVVGHTDAVGDPQVNQVISEARARTVMLALIQSGIPPVRISSQGMGANQPRGTNATLEGRRMNRRIELQVQR